MAQFNGQLRPNEVFASIYNMIISQSVMVPELANNFNLVSKYKTDGSLFGDTKLFYATDVLKSREWLGDAEAANLLNINRPDAPKCQAIVLDQFRQIDITLDEYLSKRAWSTAGVFGQFNGIVLGMIRTTKEMYETTLFNAYVGTAEGDAARATVEVPLSDISATGEEKNRLEAQTIAQYLADLLIDMKDYSRDFNDYKFMRAYNEGELMFIVNSKWANKITNLDLPTIFHKEGLNKLTENILPARYFGEVNATSGTTGSANTTVRSLIEKDYGNVHVFAGDLLPNSTAYLANETYTVDDDIICKIVTKDTFKIMSAFEVGTNFFNARSLTTNHYLTFGYSNPDRLYDKPLITVHAD